MTDTPETDTLYNPENGWTGVVPIDHARKLERERDAWKAKFIQQNKELGCEMMDPNGTIWDYAKKLQKDLDAAVAERDEARSRFNEIDMCKNGQAPCKWSLKLIAERDAAIAERDEAREQRDRLAEVLEKVCRSWNYVEVARNAIQSLANQPK